MTAFASHASRSSRGRVFQYIPRMDQVSTLCNDLGNRLTDDLGQIAVVSLDFPRYLLAANEGGPKEDKSIRWTRDVGRVSLLAVRAAVGETGRRVTWGKGGVWGSTREHGFGYGRCGWKGDG